MLRRCLSALAGLAVVGGSLAAMAPAATAAAATAHHTIKITHSSRPGSPLRHHGTRPAWSRNGVTVSMSTNWSGYAATGTDTSVSANWTQPAATCSSGDQWSAFWVGLDGWTSNTVEQTGTEVDCAGKTPKYYSWYEMFPAYPVNFSNVIKPGDQFFGSVTYTGTSTSGGRRGSTSKNYTLVLKDITENWSHTVNGSVKGAMNNSAEIITEAPCCLSNGNVLPLTDFSPVTYTNVTVNGQPISNQANLQECYIVDTNGATQDTTSALTNNSFTNTWYASNRTRLSRR